MQDKPKDCEYQSKITVAHGAVARVFWQFDEEEANHIACVMQYGIRTFQDGWAPDGERMKAIYYDVLMFQEPELLELLHMAAQDSAFAKRLSDEVHEVFMKSGESLFCDQVLEPAEGGM